MLHRLHVVLLDSVAGARGVENAPPAQAHSNVGDLPRLGLAFAEEEQVAGLKRIRDGLRRVELLIRVAEMITPASRCSSWA